LFFVTQFMAPGFIYREDLLKVTASHNRLGPPLSKLIKHRPIEKINGKRRPGTCETFCRISMNYSHAHRAPIGSPRPAERDEVSERTCLFLTFSLLDSSASAYRATHFLSSFSSTTTSKMRVQSCHPLSINKSLKFIRNFLYLGPIILPNQNGNCKL
jgi:hypothetical protein